jgi:hypothetical protein
MAPRNGFRTEPAGSGERRDWNNAMRCQRCVKAEEARYRAVTDLMDIQVCHACAEEARSIGIRVSPLRTSREAAVVIKTSR